MKTIRLTLLICAISVHAAIAQAPPSAGTSAEQARKVLDDAHKKAATATKPTAPLAKPTAPAPAATPAAKSFANVPVPAPKVVPKPTIPTRSPGDMTIDSNSLNFNDDSSKALFRGRVRLRSLAKDIDCEELEILLKKDATKDTGAAVKPAPAKPAAPEFDPKQPNKPATEVSPATQDVESDKIEKAWARGNGSQVTIVSRGGSVAVCKCGEAFFDSKTGNLIMKIWPEVEQDGKRIAANDRNTVLTLDKNGVLSVDGPVKTDLRKPSEKEPKPAAPTTAPIATPAPAPTAAAAASATKPR
jgi:hypothetical protein